MLLVKGMHGCGASVLGVRGSAAMGTHAGTTGGGMGDNGMTRFAEVVRAGVGVGAGLVHGYLSAAIRYRV